MVKAVIKYFKGVKTALRFCGFHWLLLFDLSNVGGLHVDHVMVTHSEGHPLNRFVGIFIVVEVVCAGAGSVYRVTGLYFCSIQLCCSY